MCTAISVRGKRHYFGRNLDFTSDFGERVIITPRNFDFTFRNGEVIREHEALIGMAISEDNYPLYFDAMNESGLSAAGLYFPGNAFYNGFSTSKINIESFELIPYILCKCKSVKEAEELLEKVNITKGAFSEKYPPSPLHWMISDNEKSITLESTEKGVFVYENPVGVLTNNPEFPYQLINLNNFMSVSNKKAENEFSDKINLAPYSEGMGALGLPGDNSSMSRFVRVSFMKLNALWKEEGEKNVKQFFHILDSVRQIKGSVIAEGGYEMTYYSSCMDAESGIYYYTTYYNGNISAVYMDREKLDSTVLTEYDLTKEEKINYLN